MRSSICDRFIAGLGFYGLNFNVTNLTGSVFTNNVISGAAELPEILAVLLSQKTGRKPPIMAALFIGSIALLSSAILGIYLDSDSKLITLTWLPLLLVVC